MREVQYMQLCEEVEVNFDAVKDIALNQRIFNRQDEDLLKMISQYFKLYLDAD